MELVGFPPGESLEKSRGNSLASFAKAERIKLSVVLAEMLRKSRIEGWRREWDSNPR
jgi:hypothetical protein